MQKLHLVGFTTDQKGLILSARRGARSGSFQLSLDDALTEAVEELRARQAEEAARTPRVESALPVREIQARLRQGRTVQDVARAAGVEPAWVERFAPPVFAEQAQVIRKVRGIALRRPRLGPSSHAIGDAVRRNLAERGVVLTPEEFSDAWSTRQLADGRWAVRFSVRHRNKVQVLRFDLDDATGEVSAADRTSGQLGYVAPEPATSAPTTARPRPATTAGERRPTAKRATVSTGFRPEDASAKAVSRPAKERERANAAMHKAAAKRAVDGERAATRKAKEKQIEAQAKRAEAALVAAEQAKAAERAAAATKATKTLAVKKSATKPRPTGAATANRRTRPRRAP